MNQIIMLQQDQASDPVVRGSAIVNAQKQIEDLDKRIEQADDDDLLLLVLKH